MCGDVSGEPVSLPELSKGLRSGRNVFERVGSNPTADKTFDVTRNETLQRLLTRCRLCLTLLGSSCPQVSDTITSVAPSSVNPPSSSTVARHLTDYLSCELPHLCRIYQTLSIVDHVDNF